MTSESHTPRVVVVGSSNTDMVIRGERLPRAGETVIGGEFFTAAGGKGANQAVAAARAGAAVTFVAAVGDDALGHRAVAGYGAEGIDTRFIRRVPGAASGVALILVDAGGENMISVAPGANARLTPQDVEAAAEAFRDAGVVVLQSETPLETVACAARLGHAHGATVVLNPAPADPRVLDAHLPEHVDIWVPNQSEAALLTERTAADPSQAAQAARRLQALGCRQVVVTLGPDGCLVADEEIEHVPGHRVRAVDTVGAGDAFVGALACRLAEGRPVAESAAWAVAASALAVTVAGAQPSLPARAQIEDLVGRKEMRE